MRRLWVVVLMALTVGCASTGKVGGCEGPRRALNQTAVR